MKKIAVISSLIGAYDSKIIDFDYDRTRYDFILYTNIKRLKSNTWKIKYVDNLEVISDNARSSYYYKWNPHKFLSLDYDICVWMDISFKFFNFNVFDSYVQKFLTMNSDLWIEKHPGRRLLSQELNANIKLNKDDINIMKNTVHSYYNDGFKDEYSQLVETGLSFRRFRNLDLIKLSEAIWNEISDNMKTKRDQLVFDYCRWKTNFKNISYFTFEEKCSFIMFTDHQHRPKHVDKVLLVGPWLGDKQWEERLWVPYIKNIVEKIPYDQVIVSTRSDQESLYDFADGFKIVDPVGKPEGCLLNGKEPKFNIKKNDDKDIITLSPSVNLCNQIIKDKIKKHKVFCVGMFKTGTTSLGKAFEILGYKTLHGPWWMTGEENKLIDSFNERPDIWNNYEKQIKNCVEKFDAFQDFPWMFVYKELYKWYPDAKFVYTVRNIDDIVKSEIGMWNRCGDEVDEVIKQKFIKRYQNHEKEIREFFKNKENFLELSIIDQQEGWDKLCKFLELPVPSTTFPHLNKKTEDKKKINFKIIIPGGPAVKYIDKCLQSILNQKDVNFEIFVMLDDCKDGTEQVALKYKSDKLQVFVNKDVIKNYPVGNIVEGIKKINHIQDNDVIVTVDADDWLAHDKVLQIVEKYYLDNENLLLTHGSWKEYTQSFIQNNSFAYSKQEFERGIRKGLYHASHLRTFKYKCFKGIPEHYFRNKNGRYFDSAGDVALMYSLMENAGFENIKFIPEVLYIYNRETEFNEDKTKNQTQLTNLLEIINKAPFQKSNNKLLISLVDKTFPHGKTVMNYNFTNFQSPIEWDRKKLDHDIICFTDFTLNDVDKYSNKIKIALLIEPPSIFPQIYEYVQKINNKFDYVFTFNQELLDKGENYVFYPYGGCWVEEHLQQIYSKSKNVSIIASSQNRTQGHKLRHEVISKYNTMIDGIYGKAYKPLDLKIDGLKDYRFQIVIENCQMKNYFSEKIVDCFVTGTIPIYWGCSNINEFFNIGGIFTFSSLEELDSILRLIDGKVYQNKLEFVKKNFEIAKKYMVTENGIYSFLNKLS